MAACPTPQSPLPAPPYASALLVSVERAAISHVLREFRIPFSFLISICFLHPLTLSLMIFALLIAGAMSASTTPTLPKTPAQAAPRERTLPARAPRPTPTAVILLPVLLLMCRSVAVSVNSEIVVTARLAQFTRQAKKGRPSWSSAEQTLATPAVVRPSLRVRPAPSRRLHSRRTSAPSALRGSSCLVVQRHV